MAKFAHCLLNPVMPEFYFQCEMWIVLVLRTSGECMETNFHFTDKWVFYVFTHAT